MRRIFEFENVKKNVNLDYFVVITFCDSKVPKRHQCESYTGYPVKVSYLL